MAARTAAQRATTDAQADRLVVAGITLVIVSDNVHECELCRLWEREVLSLTGGGGRLTVEHPIRDG